MVSLFFSLPLLLLLLILFWAAAPIGVEVLWNGEKFHLSIPLFVRPTPRGLSQAWGGPSRPREALARPWEAKSGLWGGPIQAKGGQSQGPEVLSQAQGSLSQALGGLC